MEIPLRTAGAACHEDAHEPVTAHRLVIADDRELSQATNKLCAAKDQKLTPAHTSMTIFTHIKMNPAEALQAAKVPAAIWKFRFVLLTQEGSAVHTLERKEEMAKMEMTKARAARAFLSPLFAAMVSGR